MCSTSNAYVLKINMLVEIGTRAQLAYAGCRGAGETAGLKYID